MWRLLLVLSVLPLIAAMAARWWFGLRILRTHGRQLCRSEVLRWKTTFQTDVILPTVDASAADLGRVLRTIALAQWHARDPKAAKSRESSRRFGLAVPPLSAMVAIFVLVVGKVPFTGALAVFLAATAFAAVIGLLTLAPELRAVATTARHFRSARTLPRADDEDAVVASAIAHSWNEALPPVLRLLQKR